MKGAPASPTDTAPLSPSYPFRDTEPDDADSDELLLARAYFDSSEFARCADVLDRACVQSGAGSLPDLSKLTPKALALRCYALYLVSVEIHLR